MARGFAGSAVAAWAVLLTALGANAAPLDVPNTFSAGTRASAAEVNANFAATEAAVNDNDARITAATSENADQAAAIAALSAQLAALQQQLVDLQAAVAAPTGVRVESGDTLVGYLLDFGRNSQGNITDRVTLLSPQGFIFYASLTDPQQWLRGPTYTVGFSGAGCVGDRYLLAGSGNAWGDDRGLVILMDSPSETLGYVPRDAEAVPELIGSFRTVGPCQGTPLGANLAYPFPANDPTVTGVPSDPPAVFPLRFAVP